MNNSKICILDTETSNQIAAGEVVERPVSVVKELVENSIDAQAKRIVIDIKQNLKEDCINTISISDNGIGMNKADLETAFYRHATSKIRKIDDLDFILSLGFRGEALPSIASVSKVSVQSRSVDEMSGYTGKVVDGIMKIESEKGMPAGTKIEVADLFYNTPARKKFLKSSAVEQGHITRLVSNFILARPDIAFILKVDGRTVLHSSGSGSLQQATVSVYGAGNTENLLRVDYTAEGKSVSKIDGLVSKPPFSRSNRKYYHFFVNGRLVKSRELSYILETAYNTLLPEKRYPLGILYLTINPKDIDVNVHPAKTEIRFRKPTEVRDAMHEAIKKALLPKINLQNDYPKATVTTEKKQVEKNIQQGLAGLEIKSENGKTFKFSDLFSFGGGSNNKDNDSTDKSKEYKGLAVTDNSLTADGNISMVAEPKSDFYKGSPAEDTRSDSDKIDEISKSMQGLEIAQTDMKASKSSEFTSKLFSMLVGMDTDSNNNESKTDDSKKTIKDDSDTNYEKKQYGEIPNPYEIYNDYLGYNDDNGDNDKKAPTAGLNGLFNFGAMFNSQKPEENKIDSANEKEENDNFVQEELFETETNLFNALKPMGQLNASYIIASWDEDLYIIDQHAAHERILFEEFCTEYEKNQQDVSMLAVPVTVELGDLAKELLLQNLPAISDFGFVVEYLGDSTFVLRGVPLWFALGKDNKNLRRSDNFHQTAEEFFIDIMDRIVGNAQGENNEVDFKSLNKEELFTLACKNAVKANQYLTQGDISWLLQKLAQAEKPQTCPHGRPTVIKISDSEIRKRFMRT